MDEVNINSKAMLPVGTLLQGGKYRIERYLSSGGFGNTYVATNTEFEEQVAIKEFFMRGISERDGDSVTVSVSNETNVEQFASQKEKFRKEARRLRKLRNAHIVDVHDLFEENGTAYYEMDLINGESLSERMKRTGHPLSESVVLPILNQVLDALDTVHAHGLYHLDLKPANIMVDQTGRALLIDFGASKQMSANEGYSVSTSSALAFTPGYAPLEQMGQNLKSFGPWTDLYALGATLYKLLTGITPPNASEVLMMTSPLMYPHPVSPHLRELIAWMMKPRLDERPQSVSAVRQFLDVKPDAEEEKTEIIGVVEPEPEPESEQEPAPEPQDPTKFVLPVKSSVSKWPWGICIALVVVVGVLFLLRKNPSTVTDSSDATGTTEQVTSQQNANLSTHPSGCPDSNHPHMIDLGLPSGTKWACCNVGASAPEQSGDYFRWGETKPFREGDNEATYPYLGVDIGKNIAGTKYDAATANWGRPWRMPTEGQMKELLSNCKYKWTTQNGVKGGKVTGPNGNAIFLPAAGHRLSSSGALDDVGNGYYWSSSPYSAYHGHSLHFYSGSRYRSDASRDFGFSVRPVAE